jgi:rhodanese-related sulfurtransferase
LEVLDTDRVHELKERNHIDVRGFHEAASTGVIEGAQVIPLPELESRIKDLHGKKNIVINCGTGFRAKAAYSVLAKHNIPCKAICQGIFNLM